jgi:hypothetical protein
VVAPDRSSTTTATVLAPKPGRQPAIARFAGVVLYRLRRGLGRVTAQIATEAVTLDPSDPFDAALIPLVETNRRKRADYAKDGDPFSSFTTSAELLGLKGFGAIEAALFNMAQKMTRLQSLRANGRMDDPQNEAVADTYLDLAVYGILTYAIAKQSQL